MKTIFADLHIHVGCTQNGRWIKIPTSRHLTVRNILEHALYRKGLDMVGIVDAVSPPVQQDICLLIDQGLLQPISGGGYLYKDKLALLLGAEIETREADGGISHTLIFLPDLELMKSFTGVMSKYIKNINMSSQNAHITLGKLITLASDFDALIMPAHVFTPHKSLYGVCTDSLSKILTDKQIECIAGIELGLSADSFMADRIKELSVFTYLTNSDAHSLDKIAREYNKFCVEDTNYREVIFALKRQRCRKVIANYGLDPRLGKYHRTHCLVCGKINEEALNSSECPYCHSTKIVVGVKDRVDEIADYSKAVSPLHRAPYYYQVPLEFIPGLGKKTYEKLIAEFNNEMNIIHNVPYEDLLRASNSKISQLILQARAGEVSIASGGGGQYGRIKN